MPEEREVAALIVSIVVCMFFIINRSKIVEIPHSQLLTASFGMLAASVACSVIEVFVWEDTNRFTGW